jgi:hypothetical protein
MWHLGQLIREMEVGGKHAAVHSAFSRIETDWGNTRADCASTEGDVWHGTTDVEQQSAIGVQRLRCWLWFGNGVGSMFVG